MMEHLFLICRGGNLPDIIKKNYGNQVKTRIICLSTMIRMLSQINQNEMIISFQGAIIMKPIYGTISIGLPNFRTRTYGYSFRIKNQCRRVNIQWNNGRRNA